MVPANDGAPEVCGRTGPNQAVSVAFWQYLHCMRIIDAYASGSGATYGTKEFKEQVHKAHWQISDKSKW